MHKNLKYSEKIKWLIIIVVYILFFFICFFMHNKQMMPHDMAYMSDMPDHYNSFVSGKAYSYMEYIVYPIATLFGETGFVALVSLFHILAIYITGVMLTELFEIPLLESTILSVMINIEMAIWIPCEGSFYDYTLTGSVWHNSTYTFMVAPALASIFELCYLIDDMSKNKVEKQFIYRILLFTLFLAAATCAKPSFVFGLGPALLLLLVIHFIKYKARFAIREFVIGVAVLPSVWIAVTQGDALSSGGGLAWMPGALWNPLTFIGYSSLLRSMAFIIAVSVCYYKYFFKDKRYVFLWLLCILGYLEAVCIVQPDPAILYHGNVTWTSYICFLPLYLYSAGIVVREYLKSPKFNRFKMIICSAFFLWHTITGAYFLYIMVIGGRYDIPLVWR